MMLGRAGSDRWGQEQTQNYSAPRQSFCLSLSVQYLINYVSYSTLHYPTGFVFDDSAQLWANRVQSTLKLGKAKL